MKIDPSLNNKNVDIEFNAHDAFLEQSSSSTIGKPNNSKVFGSKQTKGHKQENATALIYLINHINVGTADTIG